MIMFYRKRRHIINMFETIASGRMLPNAKRGGEKEFSYIKAANKEIMIQV